LIFFATKLRHQAKDRTIAGHFSTSAKFRENIQIPPKRQISRPTENCGP